MRSVDKILIIRFSSLGDILLASPLLRVVRKRFPAAQIDFLVKKEYADLVRYNPNITHVIQMNRGDWPDLRSMGSVIRKQKYDVIIDLHNGLRSRYIRMTARCPRRSVIDKRLISRFLLVHTKRNFYRDIVPVTQRYLETAKLLGIEDDGGGLDIDVPAEIQSLVDARLNKYHLDRFDRVVGFAPTARHFTKRWPQEKFVECGVELLKNGSSKILIFGAKHEAEYCGDIAHLINNAAGGPGAENLAADFSILETGAAMDRCDVIISNDSGLMHLAAARKKKLVAIFGSTVREFGFFPFRSDAAVIENIGLRCRPCSHIGRESCPKGHFKCMMDISVAQVVSAAEAFCAQRLLRTRE